uniref:Ig-like domain-containing protein n=1 Tax=Myotis lucifugus TaxID=59463 RepID=G1Q3H5_MYOLU
MANRLLCCITLCLLGVGLLDAGVTQTPRHKVTKIGQEVTLSCKPISGHGSLYWYRQTSLQGLKFLTYFRNQAPIDETGMPKDRFSAKMPNGSFSTLKIQPTEAEDSAMYLCASSLAT